MDIYLHAKKTYIIYTSKIGVTKILKYFVSTVIKRVIGQYRVVKIAEKAGKKSAYKNKSESGFPMEKSGRHGNELLI